MKKFAVLTFSGLLATVVTVGFASNFAFEKMARRTDAAITMHHQRSYC